MENPSFTKMSPEYKAQFRKMVELEKKKREEKKKKKSPLSIIAEKLYGGTSNP